MRTLAFDGRTGASGDMLLGALLDAGADRAALAPVEAALPVRYTVDRTTKRGVEATSVAVVLDEAAPDHADARASHDESGHDHAHDDGHGHDADDGHTHGEGDHDHAHGESGHDAPDHDHAHDGEDHTHDASDHDHAHHHTHAEGAGPSRTYAEVRDLVGEMDLPAGVREDALAVFERLGRAEASVHGTDLDSTHFHEVGADDAVADVVGAALLLADLGVERVVTTPLAAGGGEVEMSHGTYPVPTPAVTTIAEGADWSLRGGPVDRELLTPTGAAVLAHCAEGVETLPALDVAATGHGAGGHDLPGHPNVLRALVGESAGGLAREEISVLETNVDDASPELLGGLQDALADAGALDVSVVPLTMKKSRPGHLVRAVCRPADARRVARRLAEETGTLGVREGSAGHRWVAEREVRTVAVDVAGESHEVGVKVASDSDGAVYDVSAEYDDCAAVARETDLPTREVMRRAEDAAR